MPSVIQLLLVLSTLLDEAQAAARGHGFEAVVMMVSTSSANCSAQRLRHLSATVGPGRDVWVLYDRGQPELSSFVEGQYTNVHHAEKPRLPATLGWLAMAAGDAIAQNAAHFVAWLAAAPYERAWIVSDDVVYRGEWAPLLDFDFATQADIIANQHLEGYNRSVCTLKRATPCSSAVAPLRVDWSLARLSRRVAMRVADSLSDDTLGVVGPVAELVPAACVVTQRRCRLATLNGSLGRPSLVAADRSKPVVPRVCQGHQPLSADLRAGFLKPSRLLFWSRFDIYVKSAYAAVLAETGVDGVPACIRNVYTEHLRVWNNFSEATCAWFSRFHANCTNKRSAADFVSSFDKLITSMQSHGFVSSRGASVPIGGDTGVPINGAHRVAAATALGLRIPVHSIPGEAAYLYRYPKPTTRSRPQTYSHEFFLRKGLSRTILDWVAHRAILANPALHVVHLWPRAIAQGSTKEVRARKIIEKECSSDSGIVYSKQLQLTVPGLEMYLRHAYGDVSWLQPDRYWGEGAPMHVYVVHSDKNRVGRCKDTIRKLYELPGRLYKAAVHVTDFHPEAIVASQMLLNDNSVAYMNHPAVNWTTCNRIAASVATSLQFIGRPATKVVSTHTRGRAHPFFLLPESLAVDTGTVLDLFGLRHEKDDIDLVWAQPMELVSRLFEACPDGKRTRRPRECGMGYGTHNPPSMWWSFHNLSSPADLIHNPRLHGFCSGLKFVAPGQLLTYKRLRLAQRHEAKDRRDVALLERAFQVAWQDGRRLATADRSRRALGRNITSNAMRAPRGWAAHKLSIESREKKRWVEAMTARNATGLGTNYSWSKSKGRITPGARIDYLWKPIKPADREVSLQPWESLLALLPEARPPAGVIYMQIGAWPPWMPFLLASAAANKLATFYFVGSAPINNDELLCRNCVWLPLNESGFMHRLKSHLGVELQHPNKREAKLSGGKLNDLKPAIGVLFPELAERHKWIGYSDPDVLLGNLSHEISLLRDDSDLLAPMERFPEPLANGNFMLLRCTHKILNAFRRSRRWREVFQHEKPMAFDEWHFEGELRGNADRRYLSSIYEVWHEMLLTGDLKPQPASRFFLQDAIIQQGIRSMYPLLDSYGAKVNLTWKAGRLVVTRRGPCVCPDDVISQPSITSCPQCLKNRGKQPTLDLVDAQGLAVVRDERGRQIQPRRIHLDRTVEILGVHFQMWKKRWRQREFRVIRAFEGLRPPPSVVYLAVPDCNLRQSASSELAFYMDGRGFSCQRRVCSEYAECDA